jgi:hypothetical protein
VNLSQPGAVAPRFLVVVPRWQSQQEIDDAESPAGDQRLQEGL